MEIRLEFFETFQSDYMFYGINEYIIFFKKMFSPFEIQDYKGQI